MENTNKPEISREIIKKTAEFKKHRKQSFWQIYFPLAIVLLIIIAIIVLAVITAAQGDAEGINSKWASLTLMVIILMSSVVALVVAVILYGVVYLLAKGIRKTPEVSLQAQYLFNLVRDKTHEVMTMVATPIIKIGGVAHAVNTFSDRITGKNKKRSKVFRTK
jgi:hypothetical protein